MSHSRVLVALDFDNEVDVFSLVERLDPSQCRLKVGKELFTICGPELVKKLIGLGFDVFLDLKFHDIPNTVAKAVKAAAKLGVWMVNVHASGSRKMMQAASDALSNLEQPPLLIAVTVLTSSSQSDLDDLNQPGSLNERVLHYAEMAKASGLDGVVCSAQESTMLRASLGDEFLLVTPGIRPIGTAAGDQHRIVTPHDAISAGSSYLVVGRPITQANDPLTVLKEINAEVQLAVGK